VSGEKFRKSVFEDRRELARAVAEGVAALSRSPAGEHVWWLDQAASSGV
jgi:hypothetical protein